TVSPAVGSVSATGLYTAPAPITSAQFVLVKATSAADPTKSATARVLLKPTVSVTLTPTIVSLSASQTQQFTASVSGAPNPGIDWTLTPSVGSISNKGLYTAPAPITSAQSVTVTATSAADPTKSAVSTVSLIPTVSVTLTPTTVSLPTSQTQQFTASVS